ncbi:hypothetical protein EIP91_005558 [Steccherinum ochraceum]|uniref:BZIP domain-containing protein n=1 Tax=Steccherinum ochraceum TaxID=92696 RepID=A0A4R0RVX8_9APHY|nr:hypothetical protein EIP91_005558 [Steccherinum ochraceum]
MSLASPAPAVPSSTTLWATPSKEWVIPAKPKPGRKPKKDTVSTPAASTDQETDSKGRRVQNRAAQRAFRERKQSQLADLQARVQQYEQGEIERNVALQNIAKRLKEENERLQKENAILREKLAKVEDERDSLREPKRRWREDSRPPSPLDTDDYSSPAKKKPKIALDLMTHESSISPAYMSSPSSASSPESLGHSSFSPGPTLPPLRDTTVIAQGNNGPNALGNIFDLISTGKSNVFDSGGSMDTFDCGFCNETTPCVCREIAIQQAADRLTAPILKVETSDQAAGLLDVDSATSTSSTPVSAPVTPSSILDNLPSYQPPVPLRRRGTNVNAASIFPVTEPAGSSSLTRSASCSGDPSNCMACADDAFGKAFCAAINKSAVASPPCEKCPTRAVTTRGDPPSSGCCGNPALCGSHRNESQLSMVAPVPVSCAAVEASSSSNASQTDTIPCNDAWRQIKSHPNASFADLSLLAEVVARRSKCTGPRVEISPAPGTITPERGISPSLLSSNLPPARLTRAPAAPPVPLAEPTPIYYESRPTPMPIPTEQGESSGTISCGRSRIREVQADGVRDALRLLDLKYSTS